MAIARITGQDTFATSATASVTGTFPVASVAGRVLFAFVWSNSAADDNAMTGWTKATSVGIGSAGTSGRMTLFYKVSTGDTAATATTTLGTAMRMFLLEYSGVAVPVALDGTPNSATSGASTVTSQVTGTITSGNTGSLFLVFEGGVTGHGTDVWASATELLIGSSTLCFIGQYLPGTTLTGFQDTATLGTARTQSGLIAGFLPSTAVTDDDPESVAEGTEAIASTLTDNEAITDTEAEALAAAVPDDDTAAATDAGTITVAVSDGESSAVTDAATTAAATSDDDTGALTESESIAAAAVDSDDIEMTEGEQADAFSPVTDDDTAAVAEATEAVTAGVSNGDVTSSSEGEAIILAIADGEGGAVSDGDSEVVIPVSADIVVRANLVENPAGIRLAHARVTFSVAYTALGEPLVASDFGLRYITFASVMELNSGYAVQWDDGKLHVYDTTTGVEVAGGTDLSGLEVDVAAWQLEGPTWRT